MIIEHSSGGNSTNVLLTSEKEKHGIKIRDYTSLVFGQKYQKKLYLLCLYRHQRFV
jgi:hypothetical protein